jgi:hypothetical protein
METGAMSDIFSVLQSAYANSAVSAPSKGTYKPVDPASFQGTWSGTYANSNKKFSVQIFNVQGFRAQVKIQDANGTSAQTVLIKNNSFRVGDSKFTLANKGVAQVSTAVTNPVSGNVSLLSGTANQD